MRSGLIEADQRSGWTDGVAIRTGGGRRNDRWGWDGTRVDRGFTQARRSVCDL